MGIASGSDHVCGLRPDGQAACWGDDDAGETEAPGGVFKAVAAGSALSCGLRPSGEPECWGDDQWWVQAPPPGTFIDVVVGTGSACGLHPGGRVTCWGRWRYGGPLPDAAFVSLSMDYHFCGLHSGGRLECVDRTAERGGTWSYAGRFRQLSDFGPDVAQAGPFADFDGRGAHYCGLRWDATVECSHGEYGWWPEAPGGAFLDIAVEDSQACGIRPDSTLECWGPDALPGRSRPKGEPATTATALDSPSPDADRTPSGGSAAPDRTEARSPTRGVPSSLEWVNRGMPGGGYSAIDAGASHTCGVQHDAIRCAGDSRFTLEGDYESVTVGGTRKCRARTSAGSNRYEVVFEPIEVLCSTVVCALDAAGTARCAALGDYDPSPWLVDAEPAQPPGPVTALDVGIDVCTAVATGGVACSEVTDMASRTVYSTNHAYYPFPENETIRKISVGYSWEPAFPNRYHEYDETWVDYDIPDEYAEHLAPYSSQNACAITTDGEIYCWGNDLNIPPPPWFDHTPYQDVAVGSVHVCALDRRGEAVCWGSSTHGQTDAPAGVFTQLSAG
ncbi:MAG: RCC1 domain-containing protein, partial [Gammaproteobacteria bacterium]|nr:RCC1 domain-containing protein [Gammaproteobacteria bacterium]